MRLWTEEFVGQRCLPASDLSHKPEARASLCLSIRTEGPGAHMQCELPQVAQPCRCSQMFGMQWNASVGRGGAGEASGTSSQISDILVKSNYGDVGQISSLETGGWGICEGGHQRPDVVEQMQSVRARWALGGEG